MEDTKPTPAVDEDANDNANIAEEHEEEEGEELPYGETEKYRTWHKHVRDFYQTNMFIDTTWTSRSCQFMPYLTLTQQHDTVTQTILTGTNRDDGQNYIQMLDTTLPASTGSLASNGLNPDNYEVGGYGIGEATRCGVKVGKRCYHDGAVLACRYMPANPLLIASSSSDSNCYLFDVSTISLAKAPNDKRPTCRYAPKRLPDNADEERKKRYQAKVAARHQAEKEMAAWDRKAGHGQHSLTLIGNKGEGVTMDWSITNEGILACGSDESVAYWRIGNLSKASAKTVEPVHKVTIGTLINDVKFSWFDPNRSFISAENGTVSRSDFRERTHAVVVGKDVAKPANLALSPLNDVVIAVGGTDGVLRIFDQRNFSEPVISLEAHNGEVGPISWSPFVEGYIATGGQDGLCTLMDAKSGSLLFKHAAHLETILDIDWSWQEQNQGQLMSCDANAVTIWKPRNTFWTP